MKFQGLRLRFGLGERRPLDTWQRADQLKEALHKFSPETFRRLDEGRSSQRSFALDLGKFLWTDEGDRLMMKTDRLKEVLHPDQLYFPDVPKKDAFDFVMAVWLILFFLLVEADNHQHVQRRSGSLLALVMGSPPPSMIGLSQVNISISLFGMVAVLICSLQVRFSGQMKADQLKEVLNGFGKNSCGQVKADHLKKEFCARSGKVFRRTTKQGLEKFGISFKRSFALGLGKFSGG